MNGYKSMATCTYEIVDCRMLQLELEFHLLDQKQLKKLATACANEIQRLTGESFYLNWTFGTRRIRADKLLEKIECADNWVDFTFEGDVISDIVYNAKTFKQYDRWLLYDDPRTGYTREKPQDYFDIFREYIPGQMSPDTLKARLLQLFNKNGLAKKAFWCGHDISGMLFSVPYWNRKDLYHGKFDFKVAAACLGSNILNISNAARAFLRNIASEVPNVSGRVALSPISSPSPCSGHMLYFGGHVPAPDKPPDLIDTEWTKYYYLQGAEWFNLLSPLQANRLPDLLENAAQFRETVCVEPLSGGSIIVRAKNDVLHTDISDLLPIKKLLYDVLYPGKSEIMLEHLYSLPGYGFMAKPRYQWEYVPMLDDEILIQNDRVVFKNLHAL